MGIQQLDFDFVLWYESFPVPSWHGAYLPCYARVRLWRRGRTMKRRINERIAGKTRTGTWIPLRSLEIQETEEAKVAPRRRPGPNVRIRIPYHL
jgi:hypothetical protein